MEEESKGQRREGKGERRKGKQVWVAGMVPTEETDKIGVSHQFSEVADKTTCP